MPLYEHRTDDMTATFGRAAVLGLGLIGGSLVHAIRQSGLDVIGYDTDPQTAAAASASGFPVTASDAGAVHGADLVVLAMPLPEVKAALQSLAPHLAPGAILTDVGTLKAPVLELVREIIPTARFVGGHPLAGTELSGWDAADPLLFRDAPWALTLEPDTDLASWIALAELVCDLGAKPVPATAAEQDAAVAHVIGLPHVLAETLALTGRRQPGARPRPRRRDRTAAGRPRPPGHQSIGARPSGRGAHCPHGLGTSPVRAGRAHRRSGRAAGARPARRLDYSRAA